MDYEPDPEAALLRLREFVFSEGTYAGAERRPATPQEALLTAGDGGTRSILDILEISDEPQPCCAAPLTEEELKRYFGTLKPHSDAIDHADAAWEEAERGAARFYVAYQAGVPSHYVFYGYSFD
jgi:hypothetical protein